MVPNRQTTIKWGKVKIQHLYTADIILGQIGKITQNYHGVYGELLTIKQVCVSVHK